MQLGCVSTIITAYFQYIQENMIFFKYDTIYQMAMDLLIDILFWHLRTIWDQIYFKCSKIQSDCLTCK